MTSQTACGVGRASRLPSTAAALAVVLSVAGCQQGDYAEPIANEVTVHDDDGMHGAVLTDQYVMPDLALTATDGSSYSLTEDTTDPLTLVFFGYTQCPDICQVVMSDIASAMTRLDENDREQVGMLFITSDPARDDPQTLRTYLDRFDPDFEGVTGRLGQIVKVGNELGVPIEKGRQLPSGGYEVAHGTQIVAVDENDRSPIVWTEGTSAAALAEDLTGLIDGVSTGSTTRGGGSTTGNAP